MDESTNTQAAFDCLLAHPKVIPGALKKCGISRCDRHYQDYYQDAILRFVQAYCRYWETTPIYHEGKMFGYISRNIYWGVQNKRRKNRRFDYHHGGPEQLMVERIAPDCTHQVEEADFCRRFMQCLKPAQYWFLTLRQKGRSYTEIAHEMGISERQAYYMRDEIRALAQKKLDE